MREKPRVHAIYASWGTRKLHTYTGIGSRQEATGECYTVCLNEVYLHVRIEYETRAMDSVWCTRAGVSEAKSRHAHGHVARARVRTGHGVFTLQFLALLPFPT